MTVTERLLSMQECRDLLGISYNTLYRMLRTGKLRYLRVGNGKGQYRIPVSELDRLLVDAPSDQAVHGDA